jgi:hypothetical protein
MRQAAPQRRCATALWHAALAVLVPLLGAACGGRQATNIVPTETTSTNTSTGTGPTSESITTIDPVTGRPVQVSADTDTVEVNFKGFLGPADLTVPPDLEQIDAAALAKELSTFRDVFYLRDPSPKPFDPNDCYDNLFDTQAFMATKTALVYELKSEDFAECLNSGAVQDQSLKLEFTKATIQYFDKSTCDGVDLSPLHGKHQKDLTEAETSICDGAKSADQLRNSLIEYEFTLAPASGDASMTVRSRSIVTMMTAQGSSCRGVNDGGLWTYGPCEHTVSTVYTILDEKGDLSELKKVYKNRYLKAVGNAMTGSVGKAFYETGTMAVTFDNWQGEMAYAGGATPPKWTLSNGSASETGFFMPQ